MAHVTVKEPKTGAVAVIADVNDTLSSWVTQSTAIAGKNVRDEGLGRRMLAAQTITPASGADNKTSPSSFTLSAAAGVWETIIPGGTPMVIVVNTADTSSQCEVSFTFAWDIPEQVLGTPPRTLSVKLDTSVDNFATAGIEIPVTWRHFQACEQGSSSDQRGHGTGSHTITHLFTGQASATRYFRARCRMDIQHLDNFPEISDMHLMARVTVR